MQNLHNLLNKEQFLSVTRQKGTSLIIAGAGSGKTRVITYKIAYLIEKGVAPHKILAVTFTNKAAREMGQRVTELIGRMKDPPMISTFHSLGLYILKTEIQKLGYGRKFSIYDDKDCQKLLKDIIYELKLPEDLYDVYEISFKISLMKMNLKTEVLDENLKKIYVKYEEYLKLHNAVDFDDLIKLPLELFDSFPEVLQKYQKKWEYILIDEYQDASFMQYQFIKKIAMSHKNLSVVGDDDQSIYSWRGANSNIFTMLERDFDPVYEVRLEQNYRSTTTILEAANSIIKNNSSRKEKKLWTDRGVGDKIGFYEAENEEEEAAFIRDQTIRYINEGYKYKDIGILFRMNSQSRPIEESFREYDIPYKVVGSRKFFDRPEIRDALSYLRFLANTDDEVALHRIINNPKRGIGNTTIQALMEFSKEYKCPIFASIKTFIENNTLGNKTTPYLEDFVKLIEKYREMVFKPKNIAKTLNKLIEEIDYQSKLLMEVKNLKKVVQRMNNINQLVQSISRYEFNPDNFDPNLFEYLQRVTLMQKDDDDNDKDNQVNMMSIHSSKGLEFKIVFIAGVEEGLIPHAKSAEENGNEEEERRLFYVAVTRAREKLFLSYPKTRVKFYETLHKTSSPFMKEIPENLIVKLGDANDDDSADENIFSNLLKRLNKKNEASAVAPS
ncbi:MAG TPA: 3'-5' exonuclease [Spirochaetota bacterium]|jgi:DNA helicase-2/ATP-dependent DNA helicase PcrA|nr:MAG: ATP-dependent DNA helicase PcrA [Spirochaetes bacterium ADurb.Bin133]HPY88191.1 3'-5' exonuclease [Spirochaetota bacterium]